MREARAQLGLTLQAVAVLLPVSAKTYSRWEHAGEVPQAHAKRVREILALPAEDNPAPSGLEGRVRAIEEFLATVGAALVRRWAARAQEEKGTAGQNGNE